MGGRREGAALLFGICISALFMLSGGPLPFSFHMRLFPPGLFAALCQKTVFLCDVEIVKNDLNLQDARCRSASEKDEDLGSVPSSWGTLTCGVHSKIKSVLIHLHFE